MLVFYVTFENYKSRHMKINKFEDIISWQKSKELVLFTYKIFEHHKDFGFCS